MFDDLMGAYGSRFFIAAGGVAIALVLLVAILWIMRNRAPSPFVRGGRNRQPRLQVLDAAAVDARRRLVLVRRDDVEHLIMIGGPTDIVIESRILPIDDSEPEQPPVQNQTIEQPVMIAATEPVAPPTPKPIIARTLSPVEEYAPEPEPAPIDVEPYAPEPVQRQPVFETEMERAPRTAPVATPAPIPAPIEARPQPPVAPQPINVPPVIAQPVRTQSVFSQPEPAPIEASAAADILDSARQRVLSPQRIEPQVMATPVVHTPNPYPAAPQQPFAPTPVAPTIARSITPSAQPSDFQRVLEEEMNVNLSAERIVPQPQQPTPIRPTPSNLPRRDPEMAPMTGADAALQNEVARIFGEMSVNRDK